MTDSLTLFAHGHPIPWKRPRKAQRKGFFTEATDKDWRSKVRLVALAETGARKLARLPWDPDGWFRVTLSFGFADDGRIARCDADNLAKSVLDACRGVLWADDCRVQLGSCVKAYSDAPGVLVEVERVAGPLKTSRMLEVERIQVEATRVQRNAKTRARRRAA